MSAESLQRALRALGIDCVVEAHEKLAVIVPASEAIGLDDPTVRRAAIALLAEHGFTHLALEIPDSPRNDAAVSGD